MTGYQALYRKYRPQTFRELAGQDPIAETLRNEVRDGRLAHAYLFTGPRGTGKTTSARLLAKALNCQHGPTADPCPEEDLESGVAECQQCKAIRTGAHLDVIEIDAASNRGIDDIRSLQERVQLAPVLGRYKVFIIDEVHMLTDPAWNALLKTLEEPPPNCIFVMATTEVHKVLATVLSRCQRFDFQRISRSALFSRLRFVASREGIAADDDALDIIARRSDGGLRDALSLLDQVSATTKQISATAVYDALGMLPADQVMELGRRIADRDAVGALTVAYDLLAAGHDHRTILRELLGWARNLLLLEVAPDKAEALDVPQAQAAELLRQTGSFTQADILHAMEILRETDFALRGSNQMTIWLEVGLLRLCDRTSVPSLTDLARRVADLEARVAGGAAAAPSGTPGSTGVLPSSRVTQTAAPALPPAPPPAPPPAAQAQPAPALDVDEDVYQRLFAALDQSGMKSKSAAFKQYVQGASMKPDGTLLLRTRKTTFYKEGSEHRKFVLDHARALFGREIRLEVVEDSGTSRRPARQDAPAPGDSSASPGLAAAAGQGVQPAWPAQPAQAAPPVQPAQPAPPAPPAQTQPGQEAHTVRPAQSAPIPSSDRSAGPTGALPPAAPQAVGHPQDGGSAPSGLDSRSATNGHAASPPSQTAHPRTYDSGDPVALAAEIFLGKIVDR